ncbi:MAG: 3-isopropylmalate dehydratase small subunit [Candidatus Omnitrophota bacterium]
MVIEGKVHKFGDDVNTDEIIAAKYLNIADPKELGKSCMETLDKDFSKKVSPGDIIVAGKNFGCGSSREHAPLSIKGAAISCVVAKSFARIFYRNALNIGLPIVVIQDTDRIKSGDSLRVDLKNGIIKDLTCGINFDTEKFPQFMQEIINSGGLIKWVAKNPDLSKKVK